MICAIDLFVIYTRKVYVHIFLMWVEDVVLGLPILIIGIYLSTFTASNFEVICLVTGEVLGLLIAMGDTYMELKRETS